MGVIMKKEWHRLTINLSKEEYANLKILASLRRESVGAFVRYLLEIHLVANEPIAAIIREMRKAT